MIIHRRTLTFSYTTLKKKQGVFILLFFWGVGWVSEIPVCPQNQGSFCVDLYLNYPVVLSHTQRLPLFESTGYCQDNIRKKREYKISRSKFN